MIIVDLNEYEGTTTVSSNTSPTSTGYSSGPSISSGKAKEKPKCLKERKYTGELQKSWLRGSRKFQQLKSVNQKLGSHTKQARRKNVGERNNGQIRARSRINGRRS